MAAQSKKVTTQKAISPPRFLFTGAVMVDWEDIEEVLIEMSEEAKSSAASFEEMLLLYTELVDEWLSEIELSKNDYLHAIEIARRYNYNSEYSHDRGHDDEDDHELTSPGE